jgi:Holliday junction resolvasome RuvABC DNA-binding subunit
MSETPMKVVVDAKAKTTKYIPLSKAEIAEGKAMAVQAEAERVEQEAIAAQTATHRQAGIDALVALGLTEAQITALVGA